MIEENKKNEKETSSPDVVDGRDKYRDQVEMESGGTNELDDAGYDEEDDVRNSIAEGYY